MKSFRSVVGSEVRFSVSPHFPCPCGSRKSTSQCCLTATGLNKIPASTLPPAPKTGESLKSCYANCLADCDRELSREHYFSNSLLHYLNRDNDLRVGGLPWTKGKEQVLPPNAFASKVLCKRHNSALSNLDAIAVHLFQVFDEKGAAGSGQQLIHLFSGHDLERWLLKILCGIAYSNNLSFEFDTDLSIPDYWLRILFGEAEFPNEQGLYVCKSRGYLFKGPRGLQLRAIIGRGRLTGMGLWICGYELILSMSGFPSRVFDAREVAYRPLELYTTGCDFEKSILLSWNGTADRGTIFVTID
ncbi:MAG: hypothetical protein HZA77_01960 [Candidatus Schekmanbacteria bacterium]|nr:hypothetical protein [Candidatus Schekmanbacteria bacterium]